MDSCPFCCTPADAVRAAFHIADFEHSTAWLSRNQMLRGRTTLVARTHCIDMLTLDPTAYAGIARELRILALAIQRAFAPARMNYANYGNIEPHLHWHVVPRYPDDPWWGGPPDLMARFTPLPDAEYASLADSIRRHLP